MTKSSFLKKIYLKSLTPFELLDFCKRNDCSFEKKEQSFYMDLWKRSICKDGSNETFKEYCGALGLSASDVSLMISNVNNCEEEIDYPAWVSILDQVLSIKTIDFDKYGYCNQTKPFYQLLYPFVDLFFSSFKRNLEILKVKLPNQDVINQLYSGLYNALYDIAHLVLFEEFEKFKKVEFISDSESNVDDFFYKKFVREVLLNKFCNLFLDYPILARKLATKTNSYLGFVTSMFERFITDIAEIEYSFDAKLDEISQLHLDLGDQHNGASTVIFEFKNSYKIVYKPVNVKITHAYNHFLKWVSTNLGNELKSFNVIDKEEYGWLEYVENLECVNVEDVKLYYERAGILAGISYFLNSIDCHFENLIASGNCPVLIDHETVTCPNDQIVKTGSHNSQDKISGSVLQSHLLPTGLKIAPTYVCGFGSSVQMELNTKIPRIQNLNKDNMMMVSEKETVKSHIKNKPKLNSEVENLIDYQLEFKEGFGKIYHLILESKTKLLSKDSPLEYFRNLKIRFVYRPTFVYFRILKLLNKPEYLKDSIKYGLRLELLGRAYPVYGNRSSLLSSEREQMLLGDIPAFYTNTLAGNLVLLDEKLMVYQENAMENVRNKIKKAKLQDYQYQMDLIEEVIAL